MSAIGHQGARVRYWDEAAGAGVRRRWFQSFTGASPGRSSSTWGVIYLVSILASGVPLLLSARPASRHAVSPA